MKNNEKKRLSENSKIYLNYLIPHFIRFECDSFIVYRNKKHCYKKGLGIRIIVGCEKIQIKKRYLYLRIVLVFIFHHLDRLFTDCVFTDCVKGKTDARVT